MRGEHTYAASSVLTAIAKRDIKMRANPQQYGKCAVRFFPTHVYGQQSR